MNDDETDTGPEGAAHVRAHVPVMVGQVVRGLRPRPGARLVDATVGLAGHAAALLAAAPDTDITAGGSTVRTLVVAAREDLEIARGVRARLR